jgi:hypothetical protein
MNQNMSKGLTNGELEKIGKKCLLNFIGVYPADVIPPIKGKEKNNFLSVIFNLSPHYETGSHFIAIVKTKQKIYFFDSLGTKYNYSKSIIKFMNLFHKPIIYCIKKIQTSTSIFCSFFCLAFILHMQKQNHYPQQFYKLFPICSKKNDNIVQNFVIKEIKKIVCY